MIDSRRHAPATERNREPILAVLRRVLPASGTVLEIASGTGEHAVHFAKGLPGLIWQPSDPDAGGRASIDSWAADVPNVLPAIDLDAAREQWPIDRADAIVCINMVHISPWASTEGLLRNGAKLLPQGGPLVLYGPYIREGVTTAPSNMAFDASLRSRNAEWGIRRLEAVIAEAHDFTLEEVIEMPSNNLTAVFRKSLN